MLNLEYARQLEGWMSDNELEWLAAKAHEHTLIAEVGSWMGRSTCALADNTTGTVHAVDTWRGSDEPVHRQLLEGRNDNWLYLKFLANVGARAVHGNVVVIRNESLTVAQCFAQAGTRFDMIFLDAAHDYENVKADILAWRPLLAPGGLLAGHDYDGGRPGVVQAVKELVAECDRGPGSIWFRYY